MKCERCGWETDYDCRCSNPWLSPKDRQQPQTGVKPMARDYIEMIGMIWMPATTAAMRKDLSAYDVANIRGYAEHRTGDAQITREAVEHWLSLNSGEFQGVDDFHAVIGAAEFPWNNPESECIYCDCMYPSEED